MFADGPRHRATEGDVSAGPQKVRKAGDRAMKLTEKTIENLKTTQGQKDRIVFDDDVRGLGLRVTASGSKSYLSQFNFQGKRRRVPIGSQSTLSLADAREIVKRHAGDVARGIDPAAVRIAEREAAKAEHLALGKLIGDWSEIRLRDRRERYRTEAVRALRHAFDRFWDRPVEELTKRIVIDWRNSSLRAGKASMASATLKYGKAAFSWAMADELVALSPFAGIEAIELTSRDRVLTDKELVAVWRAAGSRAGSFGRIVRALILTGQRRDEVGGMARDELAADLSTWSLPPSRVKNGRKVTTSHDVPLAPAMRELIASAPDLGGRHVFPGLHDKPFAGWATMKEQLDRDSAVTGWHLHDLRRTVATGLQQMGVRLEVTEAILNHRSSTRGGIVGVYQRFDWAAEKRAALDAWAQHVEAIVEGREPAGNVVRLSA